MKTHFNKRSWIAYTSQSKVHFLTFDKSPATQVTQQGEMGCSQSQLPSTFLLEAPNNADGTELNSVPKLQTTEANHSIVVTNVTVVVILAYISCKNLSDYPKQIPW